MFYKYASLILMLFGASVGITGYYFSCIQRIGFVEWLWLGTTVVLAASGFFAGKLIQRLSQNSHTDYLTGTWNRRYFYLRLDEEKSRATRKKTPLCIAMIDIDGFKTINDTYGHVFGDGLLTNLAAILKDNIRNTDIVSRIGGDEFAIVFSETSLDNALEVMERIRRKVETSFSQYNLTISAGIIPLELSQNTNNLLTRADEALYKAKAQRNSIIVVAGREGK